MSTTQHYELYLTESAKEKFIQWREKMSGKSESNMVKIDNALYSKADKSGVVNATLLADSWIGDSAPFMQEVTIDGLSASQNGRVLVSDNASTDQYKCACLASLKPIAQQAGSLSIAAYGNKPDRDIPITVILLG